MTDVERMKFLEDRKKEVSDQLTGVHARIASLGAQTPMTMRQEAHSLLTQQRALAAELRPLRRAIHLAVAAEAGPDALLTQATNMVAAAQEQLHLAKTDHGEKMDALHKRLQAAQQSAHAYKADCLRLHEELASQSLRIDALTAALEAGRERRQPLLDVCRLLVMAEQNDEMSDTLYHALLDKAVALGRQQLSLERLHGESLLAAGVVPEIHGVET